MRSSTWSGELNPTAGWRQGRVQDGGEREGTLVSAAGAVAAGAAGLDKVSKNPKILPTFFSSRSFWRLPLGSLPGVAD
jgi:hypothetical protein